MEVSVYYGHDIYKIKELDKVGCFPLLFSLQISQVK